MDFWTAALMFPDQVAEAEVQATEVMARPSPDGVRVC